MLTSGIDAVNGLRAPQREPPAPPLGSRPCCNAGSAMDQGEQPRSARDLSPVDPSADPESGNAGALTDRSSASVCFAAAPAATGTDDSSSGRRPSRSSDLRHLQGPTRFIAATFPTEAGTPWLAADSAGRQTSVTRPNAPRAPRCHADAGGHGEAHVRPLNIARLQRSLYPPPAVRNPFDRSSLLRPRCCS